MHPFLQTTRLRSLACDQFVRSQRRRAGRQGRAMTVGRLVAFVIGLSLGWPSLSSAQPLGVIVDSVFGSDGSRRGQFSLHRGVAVDSQDQIVVADTGSHRIQVCDARGNCTAFWGIWEWSRPV